MAYSYSRKNGALSQVPRGGWALKRLFTDLVIEGARESGLLDALDAVRSVSAKRSRGRAIVYSNESLLRAAALRILERQKYAKDFVAYLKTSKRARLVCDFKDERTPSEATISRFFRLLSEHRDAFGNVLTAVNLRVTALIAEGREMGDFADDAPPLGYALAIDSTDIRAFSDPSRRLHIDPSCPKPDKPDECRSALPICCRPSDVKAAWGMKTDSKSKSGVSPFFGYKLHTICDAYYGTPLYALLLPANESDTKQLRPLVEETLKRYPWLTPKYLLADKGYDSTQNFVWLDSIGITPIIAVRKPRKAKGKGRATHDVEVEGPHGTYIQAYNADGYPVCAGDETMEYVGADSERGHLFRCRCGGCYLKEMTLFPVYRFDERWGKPEGALLRIVGKIPRFTKRWKDLYKLRQTIERFFGSAKRSRLLDKQQYLTMDKVEMHTQMSLLTYSATMLARLLGGDHARMRHMRL